MNSEQHIQQAVQILRQGGVVAMPTETVYGLAGDATNALAIEKIFRLKGRPATNPLIVHVADESIARRYARTWPDRATALSRAFWPGPLTLILPRQPQIVPQVTATLDSVALRVPDHPIALRLLREFDGPLAAPSANKSMHVSPTTAEHVRQEFATEPGASTAEQIDLVLDGGPCRVGIESTVIDLSGDVPMILRPGQISRQQIESVIGPVVVRLLSSDLSQPASSPGQHARHYAPRNAAFRFEPSQWNQVPASNRQVLSLSAQGDGLAMPSTADEYARHFYGMLRLADRAGVRIYIEMPPDEPAWLAVRDRIIRATQNI